MRLQFNVWLKKPDTTTSVSFFFESVVTRMIDKVFEITNM